jgi:hypothetical protein
VLLHLMPGDRPVQFALQMGIPSVPSQYSAIARFLVRTGCRRGMRPTVTRGEDVERVARPLTLRSARMVDALGT